MRYYIEIISPTYKRNHFFDSYQEANEVFSIFKDKYYEHRLKEFKVPYIKIEIGLLLEKIDTLMLDLEVLYDLVDFVDPYFDKLCFG